jgi:hypothetical protein
MSWGVAGTMLVKILKMNSLELAPWTWQSSWNSDMPDFFQGMPNGVYDNIYDELDDSPVSYHTTEPVDPTEYQNEYIGNVIGIY